MNKLKTIVFWGACWGILEASLGWFMHLVHLKNEMLLLFPFGLMCMMMAVRQTGQASAIIKTALVAALVKLSNLLALTAVPVYYVTNPAVAILLEGLVVWGFYGYTRRYSFRWKTALPVAFVIVFASMALFSGWRSIMNVFAYNPTVGQMFDVRSLMQWGWMSVVEGAMLAVGVYISAFIPATSDFARWTKQLSIPALVVSIFLTVFI
jgi:hypothetical protein